MNMVSSLTLMYWVVIIAALGILGFFTQVAIKSETEITRLWDFLSFPPGSDVKVFERTFEATNASFTTAFYSLLLIALTGARAIWIPIAYCTGILVYSELILPRLKPYMRRNVRYPALLDEVTDGKLDRAVVAGFIILSVWMWTFAELEGMLLFLQDSLELSSAVAGAIGTFLVAFIAWYLSKGGYRAVILTDTLQIRLVYLGGGSLAILTIWYITKHPLPWTEALFGSRGITSDWAFAGQTVVGVLFAQLLYYDSWQRITFFIASQERDVKDKTEAVFSSMQKSLRIAAGVLFCLYLLPVVLGVALRYSEPSGDLSTFITWAIDLSVIGPILLIFVMAFFFSALISTADTYLIGGITATMEDILGRDLQSPETADGLGVGRIIAAILALALAPALLFRTYFEFNLEEFYLYLFYSLNAFVGPLLIILSRWRMRGGAVIFCLASGFIIPSPLFLGWFADVWSAGGDILTKYIGIITVLWSIFVAGLGVRTQKREVPESA